MHLVLSRSAHRNDCSHGDAGGLVMLMAVT